MAGFLGVTHQQEASSQIPGCKSPCGQKILFDFAGYTVVVPIALAHVRRFHDSGDIAQNKWMRSMLRHLATISYPQILKHFPRIHPSDNVPVHRLPTY